VAEERTFVAIKPDGVERGHIGEIIRRYEQRGLKVVGLKLMVLDKAKAEEHYGEHNGKPFFGGLVSFITSGPIVALCLEGKNAVSIVRTVNGATNPKDAIPGTIRGDLAIDIGRNVVHGSDSPESAQREIKIFFNDNELLKDWKPSLSKWIAE
jgi:nucleoside-diphosphate kinase